MSLNIINDRPIRVVAQGRGYIGKQIIKAMDGNDGYELVALITRDKESARRTLEEELNITGVPLFLSLEEVIEADLASDLLYIATPSGLHAEQIQKSMDYGLHVWSEKPIATTFDDFLAVNRTLENHPELMLFDDLILGASRTLKDFYDAVQRVCRIAGAFKSIDMTFIHPVSTPDPPHWKYDLEMIGNAYDQAFIHIVNPGIKATVMAGAYPESIRASFGRREGSKFTIPTMWGFEAQLSSGGIMTFNGDMDPPYHSRYKFVIDLYWSNDSMHLNCLAPPGNWLQICRADGTVERPDEGEPYNLFSGKTDAHPSKGAVAEVLSTIRGEVPYKESSFAFPNKGLWLAEYLKFPATKSNEENREVRFDEHPIFQKYLNMNR